MTVQIKRCEESRYKLIIDDTEAGKFDDFKSLLDYIKKQRL